MEFRALAVAAQPLRPGEHDDKNAEYPSARIDPPWGREPRECAALPGDAATLFGSRPAAADPAGRSGWTLAACAC